MLLQPEVAARIFLAFAALTSHGPARTLAQYKTWVHKVGENEFADELILAVVARELQIRIVVVPWTPSNSDSVWAISSYPEQSQGDPDMPVIYLGNNDVHYVWLALVTDTGKETMRK